ncbi:uncharacterized protein [Arachis hypogaea]|uniref:uncharacterized protein n=1 Tax=Arachis hypogaea TaxID=3818 RepID=UPI000DEC89CB|nr:uncharacterized protein LOC112799787 [Arachis hypogaea]QHO42988.1 putative B3 domain-containing protein [Arachis hypogaea]
MVRYDERDASEALASLKPRIIMEAYCLIALAPQLEDPIRKTLSKTGVNPKTAHRDAIIIPTRGAKEKILPHLKKEEIKILKDGIRARVFDTCNPSIHFVSSFAVLNDGKYVIIRKKEDDHRWSDFVREAGLKEEENVDIWPFRHAPTGDLAFVFEKLGNEDPSKPQDEFVAATLVNMSNNVR